ncbi:hypothetical protein WICMUC_002605 [Wickerhamomyces mucosus]|uniref:GPI ethanolamine phosphate transferase 2 n=1 Tax=Wickerhamomyces mucosus TaxID=1378264 RepID=A0A9P8TEL2_9ASCO|nr:hypothetical protein WICMUC_002605 [Wickerhamomyces mucosus]
MNWLLIIITFAFQLTGIFYFCLGFFPSKVVLQGYGEFSNGDFEPQFDKMVVMVVDALRSDFLFSEDSSFKFIHSLIRDGSALGYTAFSNPPTVTLPRLKGITTGSTPNFLDAVLNVIEEDSSSTLANQDSWLRQLKAAGKKIHMYGDDTWIKLFPTIFDVAEGTSSFFVSDFTEVDNNVTRHLDHELKTQDWDCLILHYLGLDHIGHKGGPSSTFMGPKQAEMDNIAERVYNSLDDRTLFVLLGDHGMNDIGNHGGSSSGETSAALVFISNKLKQLNSNQNSPLPLDADYTYYRRIEQIDIVPTISSLLHLPTPKNSLGIFIRDFLPLWHDSDQRKNVLVENLKHYLNFGNFEIDDTNEDTIYDELKEVQLDLTRSSTNYDEKTILIGLYLISVSVVISIILSLRQFGFQAVIFSIFSIVFGSTAFGSSLVEEEHQIWWWALTIFITVFSFKWKLNMIFLITAARFIRGWNTTGQKFVGYTLTNYLQNNIYINWILVGITISAYAFNLSVGGLSEIHPIIGFLISFLLIIISVSFKLIFSVVNGEIIPKEAITFIAFSINQLGVKTPQESLIGLAQLFYTVLLLAILLRVISKFYGISYWYFTDFHNLIVLALIFQSSITNIPIFLLLLILKNQFGFIAGQYQSINKATKIGYITFASIILQNFTFFSFGQTNSLNTIDLSNAYNGIESYDMITVGLLTFVSNFGGSLYWLFGSLSIIFENKDNLKIIKYHVIKSRFISNILFYSIVTLFTTGSCFTQRYHLFIWTVFSPKLLYSISWNFFMNFAMEILCLLIVWLY